MMGKSHIAVNTCILTGCLSAAGAAVVSGSAFSDISRSVLYAVAAPRYDPVLSFLDNHAALRLLLMSFCYILGSLFPDVDNETSIVGRCFRLPFEHRTWTHSIWAILLFGWIGMNNVFTLWFFMGYVLHILMDSLSAGGICFWYPFQRFKKYASGAFVAKGHNMKLYRAGRVSEGLVVTLICGLFLFLTFWFGIYKYTGLQFCEKIFMDINLLYE